MFGIEYNVKDIAKQRIGAILDVLFWIVLTFIVIWQFTVHQENVAYTDYKNVAAYVKNIEVISNEADTSKSLKYELQIGDNLYDYETKTNIGSIGQSISMIMTTVDEKDWEYKIETSLNEFLVAAIQKDRSSAAIMSKCVYVVILSLICNASYMNVRRKIKQQVIISDKQGRLNKNIEAVK